jgi:signal transduction histidine kinase
MHSRSDIQGSSLNKTMLFVSNGRNEFFVLSSEAIVQSFDALNLRIHPADMIKVIEAFNRSAGDLSPLEIEFRAEQFGKGELWIESRAIPVLQPGGGVMWHGFMQDICIRKLAEIQQKITQTKLRALVNSRESLREDERKRIAWEMHEELGQLLAAMRMRMSGMCTQLPKGTHGPKGDSRVILGLINQSIRIVRTIVTDLHPTVLRHGIATALEWLVTEFKTDSGMECELRLVMAKENSPGEKLTTLAFRIAQEALENAVRQTNLCSVLITWESNRNEHCLSVQHDGDELPYGETSLCFFGMEERVRAYGGTMQISSTLEYGTVIEARFPNKKWNISHQ